MASAEKPPPACDAPAWPRTAAPEREEYVKRSDEEYKALCETIELIPVSTEGTVDATLTVRHVDETAD
jgi:hypothetical protein